MSYSKKIILTGATGLIGKEAIQPLKDLGFDIYALTIDKFNPDCGITWISCNIFDENSLKDIFEKIKPEYLLNFAWCTTEDYLTSNLNFDFLKAGLNLLKYFKLNDGKRVVFTGSYFEYDPYESIFDEYKSKINPNTIYGKCKNFLRETISLYCSQNEISFAWTRFFNIYGINENPKRLVPYIINNLITNKEVIIKSSNITKDYLYSKDVAKATIKLLDSKTEGIVNICSGTSLTIKDITILIAKKLNKESLLRFNYEISNKEYTGIGNNNRLLSEVGYKTQYTLDSGLDEILRTKL